MYDDELSNDRSEFRTKDRRSYRRFPLLLLLGMTVSACDTGPKSLAARPFCDFNAVERERQKGVDGPALLPMVAGSMSVMPLNSVNVTDFRITSKVMVQEVTSRRTETGTAQVWTRMVNCTDFPLQVEGRTHFLDQGKAPVEQPSAWQRVYLSAKTIGTYSEKSTSTEDAAFYYIELREGS